MSVNFLAPTCQDISDKKVFGLCDDRPQQRAYLDETDGAKWVAVIANELRHTVTFTAVDHCITILKADGTMHKRCDGLLTYDNVVLFVELKERGGKGTNWIAEGYEQLRTTISHFEASDLPVLYTIKKAYIANGQRPKFRFTQTERMERFFQETGYVLRIERRIVLD
ncbi:MAG: hypothetical protein KF763_04835 [Cyclobacteriaceae bacterium]|nr:hypothetical protein [Cytophagales bacterium]MBX2894742.1 hypothetical protein [Cyclobacteriaceae bacterium]